MIWPNIPCNPRREEERGKLLECVGNLHYLCADFEKGEEFVFHSLPLSLSQFHFSPSLCVCQEKTPCIFQSASREDCLIQKSFHQGTWAQEKNIGVKVDVFSNIPYGIRQKGEVFFFFLWLVFFFSFCLNLIFFSFFFFSSGASWEVVQEIWKDVKQKEVFSQLCYPS